jgi:hypothetical protein
MAVVIKQPKDVAHAMIKAGKQPALRRCWAALSPKPSSLTSYAREGLREHQPAECLHPGDGNVREARSKHRCRNTADNLVEGDVL